VVDSSLPRAGVDVSRKVDNGLAEGDAHLCKSKQSGAASHHGIIKGTEEQGVDILWRVQVRWCKCAWAWGSSGSVDAHAITEKAMLGQCTESNLFSRNILLPHDFMHRLTC
jgi:hypothetical protein